MVGERLIQPAAEVMAALVGWLLGIFGVPAQAGGNLVVSGGSALLRVNDECVSAPAYATLVAVALSVERGVERRGLAALLSCLGFFALNVVRVFSVALVLIYLEAHFELVHEYLWNAVLFVLITGWVAWALFYRRS